MSEFDNPYRAAPGSEPPVLAGRAAELEAIRYAIGISKAGTAAQPIVLIGLRGMGKTAVLRRCIAGVHAEGGIALYAQASRELRLATILCRGLERVKKDSASIPDTLRSAFDEFIKAFPEPAFELPEKYLVDALEVLNAAVRKHARFLLFAVDDLQECPPADILTLIRLAHQTASTSEPVLLLGAGLPESVASLHSIRADTERWRYFRLELLTKTETVRAINEPAQERNVICEHAALERLVSETRGYPLFVQEYACATWIHHRGNRIDLDDVIAIAPGVRKIINGSYYDGRFRSLTPRECRYVLALDALGEGAHTVAEIAAQLSTTSDAVSSTRNQLIKKNVVYSPAGGLLEFRMPLTSRYIAEHRLDLKKRAQIVSSTTMENSH